MYLSLQLYGEWSLIILLHGSRLIACTIVLNHEKKNDQTTQYMDD